VFGIFTSRAMRERGEYQIQLMKTRSSSGVGMKIGLQFDVDSLRITDNGDDGQGDDYRPKSSTILDDIKRKATATTAESTTIVEPTQGLAVPKVRAQSDSTKLRQFLNNLGGDSES
jgi:hypothetical protein